jgi:hypothetical protein
MSELRGVFSRASAYKLRGSGGKAGLEEQAFQVFV